MTEEVYGSLTPADTAQCLKRFLVDMLSQQYIPASVIRALKLLENAPLRDGTINNTADQLSISSKTFIQLFKKHVGLTPAKWHHLLLLNKSLKLMSQLPYEKLTDTCYELDFTDQSHFIHFFKKHTEFTPSAYIRAIKEKKVNMQVPNSITVTA